MTSWWPPDEAPTADSVSGDHSHWPSRQHRGTIGALDRLMWSGHKWSSPRSQPIREPFMPCIICFNIFLDITYMCMYTKLLCGGSQYHYSSNTWLASGWPLLTMLVGSPTSRPIQTFPHWAACVERVVGRRDAMRTAVRFVRRDKGVQY